MFSAMFNMKKVFIAAVTLAYLGLGQYAQFLIDLYNVLMDVSHSDCMM